MSGKRTELAAYLADRDAPCPRCGYNLRSATSPVCPECGQTIVLDELKAGLMPRRLLVPIVATLLTVCSVPLPWMSFNWLAPAWTKTDGQYGAFATLGNLLLAILSVGIGGTSLVLVWIRPRRIRSVVWIQFSLALGILGCVVVIMLNGCAAMSYALEK